MITIVSITKCRLQNIPIYEYFWLERWSGDFIEHLIELEFSRANKEWPI